MSRTTLPIIGFLILVCSAGSIHGVWTERWSPSNAMQETIGRLERVPGTFGHWTSQDNEVEPGAFTRAGIRGYVFRTYRDTRNGTALTVLLVCGQGGPICAHTPDICYSGNGYTASGADRRMTLDNHNAFWTSHFVKSDALVPERLQVFWSWSIDAQSWQAPDNHRLKLARYPVLFKLYLVRNLTQKAKADEEPVREFLTAFLPELEKIVGNPAS